MAKPEPNKRSLSFANFEEMMAEVRSLLDGGYVSIGNWTLAQTCAHLSDWMRFPMDGFPKPPLPMRMLFWVMKITIGPGMKRKILSEGFAGGMPTAPETVPEPGFLTDLKAVELLQQTIGRLMAYNGDFLPSPLFGPMDKATVIQISLLHAEHHLGYLKPQP